MNKDLVYSFQFKSSTEEKKKRTCDKAVSEQMSIKKSLEEEKV